MSVKQPDFALKQKSGCFLFEKAGIDKNINRSKINLVLKKVYK